MAHFGNVKMDANLCIYSQGPETLCGSNLIKLEKNNAYYSFCAKAINCTSTLYFGVKCYDKNMNEITPAFSNINDNTELNVETYNSANNIIYTAESIPDNWNVPNNALAFYDITKDSSTNRLPDYIVSKTFHGSIGNITNTSSDNYVIDDKKIRFNIPLPFYVQNCIIRSHYNGCTYVYAEYKKQVDSADNFVMFSGVIDLNPRMMSIKDNQYYKYIRIGTKFIKPIFLTNYADKDASVILKNFIFFQQD
jgi:hypothetical protein